MKRIKLYLDTSVASHLDAPDAPEKMADTKRLWEIMKIGRYDIVISDATVDELESCSEPKRSFMYSHIADIAYTGVPKTLEAESLAQLYAEKAACRPKAVLTPCILRFRQYLDAK